MKLLLFIILTTLISPIAMAGKGDKSLGGCGLGWAVAPRNSMVSSTTRGTTNSSTLPFGTTSGTSGCAQHSIVFNHKLKQHMATVSFDELMTEMSKGRGENLIAFSRAVGCSDNLIEQFSSVAKSEFSSRLGRSETPIQLVKQVEVMIQNNSSLAQGCVVL